MRGGFDSRRPHHCSTHPQQHMKKSFIALTIASIVAAGAMFGADTKTETKVAACCAKAKADGKTCTHACCVEAAKAGNNCAKCGGSGKIVTDAKK